MAKKKIDQSLLLLMREELTQGNVHKSSAAQTEEKILRRLAAQAALRTMIKHAHQLASSEAEETGGHISAQTLSDFVRSKLDAKAAEAVKAHLRVCMECFVRMAREEKKRQENEKAAKSVWQEVIASVNDLISALAGRVNEGIEILRELVAARPKTAFASVSFALTTAVLVFMLWPGPMLENFSRGEKLLIANLGTVGFITDQETRKYEGMKANLNAAADSVILQWPPVLEAVAYEIFLHEEGKPQKLPFIISRTAKTAALAKAQLQPRVKYVWRVSGKLRDGRVFTAEAGFMLRK